MKIALVDDYLNKYGGAAQVVSAIHEIFPEAPIYTIFSNVNKGKDRLLDQKFKEAKIVESWFAKLPFHERLISPLRFLIPLVWASFDFSQYDLVISSASWAMTKGLARGKAREICYCHTPPRYLYGYETAVDWQKDWHIRLYARMVSHFMRLYDFKQAQRVTWFVANSQEVQKRIKKFYRRDSAVIYPPVEINEEITPEQKKKDYFMTGGRLELLKNFDLIIETFNRLKLPLKIYGVGPQRKKLEKMAGSTIEFLGLIGNSRKQKLLSKARAFIAAATDEDFGMTPVEAMAQGCPVIAFRGGGYLESVIDVAKAKRLVGQGPTGIFFDEPTVDSLIQAIKDFNNIYYYSIKPEDCRRQAKKFSKERFKREMWRFVENLGI